MKKIFFLLLIIYCWSCQSSSPDTSKPASGESGISSEKTNLPNEKSSPKAAANKKIIFFGNSLTAAYGLDPTQGFVGLIGQRLDSLGLNYEVVNAGLSGETSAGGASRIDWVLRQPIDIFILELGANDGLRGTDPKVTFDNLSVILTKVKNKYPDATLLICAMEALPNMGEEFRKEFRSIYPRLAKQHDATLIPFFLEGVGGVPELNQPDGIHPTASGHKIVAQNIWSVLKNQL